jgi:NNP family nitrate/nitrite transporter-like MFS transporter
LGGFLMPIAFGALNDLVGIWQSCFMLLFVVVLVSLLWMHYSIRAMERGVAEAALRKLPELPEMQPIHEPKHEGVLGSHLLDDWRPEDRSFWEAQGKKIAKRNLWLSIPSLCLSFAVWMVWSVVVAKLPAVGFQLSTDQLFWLAALPALSGATLRIFYSFVVPIFGGRLWTTLSTWSLLIPAMGIGFAVQDPDTPYWILLMLALLCGFGGGNFASSMSNISFFFPKAEKGHALALNAGLGNLGVSAVQFVVPLVITFGVFGAIGGDPHIGSDGVAQAQPLWLQNAGFIWVPFIVASAIAAWFGMNDLSSAKASFAEQSIIFRRSQTWIMCWLYLGTFGSFIGYSAAFPLLAKIEFPHVPVLQLAFLGPLVGALARSFTGWVADRWGGARVTFWVFVGMAVGVVGVMYFTHERNFAGFFASFLFLFFVSGVGNASTFQMIPAIMRKEIARLMPSLGSEDSTRQAEKESAAIIGFSSAIAAYGGFFIPKSYGSSIALTGTADMALWGFFAFYLSCIGMTWWVYTRRGGLLHDIERRKAATATATAA